MTESSRDLGYEEGAAVTRLSGAAERTGDVLTAAVAQVRGLALISGGAAVGVLRMLGMDRAMDVIHKEQPFED